MRALAAAAVAAALLCSHPSADAASFPFVVSRTTRLLVVSPHPDDAALAAAGLIARVRRAGGAVQVVQMTSGDAFFKGIVARRPAVVPSADDYRAYGAERQRETIAAMRMLGVGRSHITFLGFPDDGLCLLASSEERAPYRSPYTKRDSPPVEEQVIRGVTYRGEDLRRELARVIAEFEPTAILVPHPRDEHPDHCATHLFVHDAIEDLARAGATARPIVLHYLIHYRDWPMSTAGSQLAAPPAFPAADGAWHTLALTPAEAAMKKRALAEYRTQLLALADLVGSFERNDEIFSAGEPQAAPACWCRGENIAGRTHATR